MDVGLTTIEEKDIVKHLAVAQAMVTRFVSLDDRRGKSGTEIAGTGRRFVSTVSTGGLRKTREVELAKTIQSVRPRRSDALDCPAYAAVPGTARRGHRTGRRRCFRAPK